MNTQSLTQEGQVVRSAKAALFGASPTVPVADLPGRFANIDSADGLAQLAGADEKPRFIIDDYDSDRQELSLLPLTPWRNYRVRVTGTAVPVGAEIATAANGLAVEQSSETTGVIGDVEEGTGADGLVLFRPYN